MSGGSDRDSHDRAARRADWPVKIYRLGSEPADDLSATTTAEQRIEMVWALTQEAWSVSNLPIPDYPRHLTPIRIIRRSPSSGGSVLP